jgi:hypothetical protein
VENVASSNFLTRRKELIKAQCKKFVPNFEATFSGIICELSCRHAFKRSVTVPGQDSVASTGARRFEGLEPQSSDRIRSRSTASLVNVDAFRRNLTAGLCAVLKKGT